MGFISSVPSSPSSLCSRKKHFPIKAGPGAPGLCPRCGTGVHVKGSCNEDPFLCRYLYGNLAGLLSREQ